MADHMFSCIRHCIKWLKEHFELRSFLNKCYVTISPSNHTVHLTRNEGEVSLTVSCLLQDGNKYGFQFLRNNITGELIN